MSTYTANYWYGCLAGIGHSIFRCNNVWDREEQKSSFKENNDKKKKKTSTKLFSFAGWTLHHKGLYDKDLVFWTVDKEDVIGGFTFAHTHAYTHGYTYSCHMFQEARNSSRWERLLNYWSMISKCNRNVSLNVGWLSGVCVRVCKGAFAKNSVV